MKILAIQNRMGIGDTVIFLPYIKAISEKFKTPINILVKKKCKSRTISPSNKLHRQNYFIG